MTRKEKLTRFTFWFPVLYSTFTMLLFAAVVAMFGVNYANIKITPMVEHVFRTGYVYFMICYFTVAASPITVLFLLIFSVGHRRKYPDESKRYRNLPLFFTIASHSILLWMFISAFS